MKKISDLTDKDVIHCPTEEEAEAILKLADEAGHPWGIHSNCWHWYKEQMCYNVINSSYTELDWYVKNGYTVHKASEFLEPVRKFKIGDKVVPIGKSRGTMSNYIERDLKKQGYLYITQINKDTLFYGYVDYVCDTTESGSGDFFMEEDLIPYVEEFVLPKKWCVFIEDGDSVPDKYKGGCYKTRYYAYSEPINGQLFNYIAGLGKMDAYKEITFEQFKKYVLKQDDMQLTELPQAWFVKNDKSQLFKDTVIKYLNCNYRKDYDGSALSYYGIDIYGRAEQWSDVKYFGVNAVELTLEQFIKLTTKDMTKEIIGYKCPQDFFGGHVKKGEIYTKIQDGYGPQNSPVTRFELPKEIVETWEPVFAQYEYKIGDWVCVTRTEQSLHKKEGDVFKVLNIAKQYLYFDDNSTVTSDRVRFATPQEVESHLIALAKEKGFVDGVTYKSFLGYTFNVSNVRFRYSPIEDVLEIGDVNEGWFSSIYEKGKWATIIPTKKVVSVGGKFDVTIKNGKIWHNNDDITTFVKELVAYAEVATFSIYAVKIKDITFSKTGCQDVQTTLGDWLYVWDMYNKLQK